MSTATDARTLTGRPPSGPERLGAREWLQVLRRTVKEFVADDCIGLAQQVAYSSLLASFPAMIVLIGFLGLIDAYDDLKSFLGTVAPAAVIDAIELAEESSRGDARSLLAVITGGVVALWAASGAMAAVVKAVNRAYDRLETRPFWKLRLLSAALVVLSASVTVAMLGLIVFGGPLGEAISDKAHLGGAFHLVWGILRWPIAFLTVLLFFAIVYYVAPDKEQAWRWISPGSLVAGALWLALSGLFALYTAFANSYDETYGSLAGAVVLLLWLNFTAWAILFGAELNAELDRQAEIHAAGGPGAGLVKPARRA